MSKTKDEHTGSMQPLPVQFLASRLAVWLGRLLMTRYGPGPSFVEIESVVCSISITAGRVHRGGPIRGIGRDLAELRERLLRLPNIKDLSVVGSPQQSLPLGIPAPAHESQRNRTGTGTTLVSLVVPPPSAP